MAREPIGFVRGGAPGAGLQRGRAVPAGGFSDASGPVFEALADPTRRRLVTLLGERGGASATELSREVPVTRQAVTKHLGALTAAGLATATREGREVRYRLTPEPLSGAMAWMADVGAQWDDRLATLKRAIEERE
jgi:ArsR family transcriptional regulator, cadmium/lead-responsive transcriptional repressor